MAYETMPDEQLLLQYFLEHKLPVMTDKLRISMTIGILIDIAASYREDNLISPKDANEVLCINGIKVDEGFIYISISSSRVSDILRSTPWGIDYARLFRRLPGAKSAEKVDFGYRKKENSIVFPIKPPEPHKEITFTMQNGLKRYDNIPEGREIEQLLRMESTDVWYFGAGEERQFREVVFLLAKFPLGDKHAEIYRKFDSFWHEERGGFLSGVVQRKK